MFSESTLECVELPSTLKRIEYDTFEGCKNLKYIDLPERLEYIGKWCFKDSALESITLPNSLRVIEEEAFYQCENLKSVAFPNALVKIGLFAFYKTGLAEVKLPASLKTIEQGVFAECKSLKIVKFCEGLAVLGTDEFFERDNMCNGVFEESTVERVELPTTLKIIEHNTFKNCKNLQDITLPDCLEYIGKQSF